VFGFSPHWWKRSQRADVSNVAPCSTGCWVWLCVITCRSLVISGSFVGLVLVGSYSAAMALSRLLTVNAGHCEVCVAISMKLWVCATNPLMYGPASLYLRPSQTERRRC